MNGRKRLRRVTVTQLVELTGRSDEFIRQELAQEPPIEPVERTAREIYYVASEALERIYRGAGGLDPIAERARKDRADADLKEHELQRRRRELIPAGESDHGYIALARVNTDRLSMIPAETAAALAAESRPALCERILRRAIEGGLRDIAEVGRQALRRLDALKAAERRKNPPRKSSPA